MRLDSFDLDPFFLFDEVKPNTCIADIAPEAPFESVKITCRLVRGHMRCGNRLSDLDVIVPCDSPPDVVFTWGSWCLVQERTLRIFQDEGLTGFSSRPARARSQDGRAFPVSELVITGWGGIAPEASGIRELERCPACGHEHWARVTLSGTEVMAIEPVILDRPTLEAAQYISDGCYVVASRVSGIPARDLMEGKVNPVRVLFDRL